MKTILAASALALAVLATPAFARLEVEAVRFHNGFTVQPLTVALVPADPSLAKSLEFSAYANQVGAKLEALGFKPATDPATADLVGEIGYSTVTRQEPIEGNRSPVSVGVGVGGGSGGFGVNIGTVFGLGGSRRDGRETVTNRLELRLKRPSDNQVVWEGRANAQARAGRADSTLTSAMPGLIEGLLDKFPGPSGQTVRVKTGR
jgi:opacity protein-like surface antigen